MAESEIIGLDTVIEQHQLEKSEQSTETGEDDKGGDHAWPADEKPKPIVMDDWAQIDLWGGSCDEGNADDVNYNSDDDLASIVLDLEEEDHDEDENALCGTLESDSDGLQAQQQPQAQGSVQENDEFTAPFRNTENVDFSVEEICDDVLDKISDVLASVPSLLELCTKALWIYNRQSKHGCEFLPGPMKRMVTTWQCQKAFTSMQLSRLHRVLATLERGEMKDFDMLRGRNVWSVGPKLDRMPDEWSPDMNVTGSLAAMVIPYNYASCGYLDNFFYNMEAFYVQQRAVFATSLLVSVLDLMLPVHIQEPMPRKEKQNLLTEQDDDAAIVASASIALNRLKKRYPAFIGAVKNQALPYLYWLRGHNKLAVQEFLCLADSKSVLSKKVSLLYEAARLCRMQNQMDAARKLLHHAHDLPLHSRLCRDFDDERKEVTVQFLMMCANTFDQGLLSPAKALESLEAWESLTTLTPPAEPVESLLLVVESLLCFHLAHLPGQTVSEKLHGIVSLVEKIAKRCALCYLHLSLVHAWLGQKVRSVSAFQEAVEAGSTPGLEFKPVNVPDHNYTPWQPIVDAVNTSSRDPPHPLQVVWRTQLGNLRLIKDLHVFEGDLCGRSLSLRLSPDGHLTGDLHLLLPPVRAFNLDLYTGQLVMPSTPGLTYVNKTLYYNRFRQFGFWVEYPSGPYAVTATELYCDGEGHSVHLLASGASSVLFVEDNATCIQWTDNHGECCKISLRPILKEAAKKKVEDDIKEKYTRPEKLALALRGLEYCFQHNIQLKAEVALHAGRVLRKVEKSKRPSFKGRRLQRFMETEVSNRCGLMDIELMFKFQVMDFVIYGHTLCIWGSCGWYKLFFVFFDISSKEAFQNPVVELHELSSFNRMKVTGRHQKRVSRSEVLCCCHETWMFGTYFVFGPGGREVRNNCTEAIQGSDIEKLCVYKSSLYILESPAEQLGDQVTLLTELRLDEQGDSVEVHKLNLNIQKVKVVADRLLLLCDDGLRVICPQTWELQPLFHGPDSDCQLPLSEDGLTLLVKTDEMEVLGEKTGVSPAGVPTVFVAVAVHNYLLLFAVQERNAVPDSTVEIAFCVQIAGHATEICFLDQTVGYLISATMHTQREDFYRETVYHLSPAGQLLGVLPFLGPGPRDFFPLLLPPARRSETEETQSSVENASWHVYMRDGHEGIIAVKL